MASITLRGCPHQLSNVSTTLMELDRLFKIALDTFTESESINLPTKSGYAFLGAYGFAYLVDSDNNPCGCSQVDLNTFALTTTISTGITGGGCGVGFYDFETDYVYAV